MKTRVKGLWLALPALLLLGGCALEPSYRYAANAGAGYYYGQSPYGNADTVVTGGYYGDPWGFGGWGPWGYPALGYGGWYGRYPGWDFGFGPWGGYGSIYYQVNHRAEPRREAARPVNLPPPMRSVRAQRSRQVHPVRGNHSIPRPAPATQHRVPTPAWRAPVLSAPVAHPTHAAPQATRRVH